MQNWVCFSQLKTDLLRNFWSFHFKNWQNYLTPIYVRNLLWLEWFLASRRLFVTKNIFKKSLLSFTWFADRYLEAMEDGKVLSMSRYAMLGNIRTRLSNCTTSEKYNLSLNSLNMSFQINKNLSTSIYDLVLIYVCHFHHHPHHTFWKFMLFCQIMDYRDTRAYILDPCIQEFCLCKLLQARFTFDQSWEIHRPRNAFLKQICCKTHS